jgi:hypothetical protein
MIVKVLTSDISYVLKSNCDESLENPKRFGCTVHQMMTLHILQYNYSLMTGSVTVCYCIDYINCTAVDGWKKCTEGMAVATQFVNNWYYSSTLRLIMWCVYSDRLLF